MLLSVLISGLGFIPMLVIALVVYAIRTIVAKNRNKNQNYQQPPTTDQYSQNYTPPPNTQQDSSQQPYNPNTQSYQQPNYTSQNPTPYSQPYTNATQPQNSRPQRNTAIPNDFSNYTSGVPKKTRNVGVIIAIIFGALVVILVGGLFAFSYLRSNSDTKLKSADFNLAFQNPTENEFRIVLDDWDTIQVAAFSASTDIAYTYREAQTSFHWKILDSKNKVVADTTLTHDEIQDYFQLDGREEWDYTKRTILLNPSQSDFIFWTIWYGEEGNDTTLITVGDSTFLVDAYVVSSPFIFDARESTYKTDLENASRFSELDKNQFLLSTLDFAVLYDNLFSGENFTSRFNNYRNTLIELFNSSRLVVLAQSNQSNDEIDKLNMLESLIPPSINAETRGTDFKDVIEYVRTEEELFNRLSEDNYNLVLDSADLILKQSYTSTSRQKPFAPLHFTDYYISRNGIWSDEPKREILTSWDRNAEGGRTYE